MPKQQVTLEIEVPEGWEATGEYRSVRYGETYLGSDWSPTRMTSQRETEAQWPILRRKPDPVTEWIAAHPWLPEGCWVYYCQSGYGLTNYQPRKGDDRNYYMQHGAAFVHPYTLATLFGREFTPPPVDCLQVVRTNP